MNAAADIAAVKEKHGKAVYDGQREELVIDRALSQLKNKDPVRRYAQLFAGTDGHQQTAAIQSNSDTTAKTTDAGFRHSDRFTLGFPAHSHISRRRRRLDKIARCANYPTFESDL